MAKIITGIVASDKADKTVVVKVSTRKTNRLYKKQYTSTKKIMAHDENNEARIGDKVSLIETRPISSRKRFKIEKVIERAPIRHVEPAPEEQAV